MTLKRSLSEAVRGTSRLCKTRRRDSYGMLLLASCSVLPSQAWAQEATTAPPAAAPAATDASRTEVQDIVVTANRQASTVSKTPLAVTALDASALAKGGIIELRNLTSSVPNVQMRTVNLASSIGVSIRGITSTNYNIGGQPAIATYIDGVLTPRTQGLNGDLFDLARVEVLRGPQGTLYGRNSTGGNLNIITAAPEDHFDAAASLSYGSFNELVGSAMVNLPVSDTFAVRIAGTYRRNDGIYKTAQNNLSGIAVPNYGQADNRAVRVSALWTPTPTLTWNLSAESSITRGTPGTSFETGANGQPVDGRDPFENPFVSGAVPPSQHINNFMIRSRLTFDIARSLTLAYIAGYQNLKFDNQLEFAGAPSSFLNIHRFGEAESQYHEVDLTYDSGALYNVFGGNYTHLAEGFSGPTHFVPTPTGYAAGFNAGTPFGKDFLNSSWGVFDQATLKLSSTFRVIAGLRYSDERSSLNRYTSVTCPGTYSYAQLAAALQQPVGSGCTGGIGGRIAGRWSKVTWRGGIQYDISGTSMAYATATSGFKSGGLNQNAALGVPQAYAPETAINYEAGFKGKFLNNAARLNIAAFYTPYSNLQVNQFLTTSGGAPLMVTANAARADIYGLEADGEWQITTNDKISGFATYLHARYKRYDNAIDSKTNVTVPSLADNMLINAPDFTLRGEYSHRFDLGNQSFVTMAGAAYWQSKMYLREINAPIDRVDAYAKLDFNLTYERGDRWTVRAFVHNATNKITRNGAILALKRYFSDYDPPRTYGVQVSFKY